MLIASLVTTVAIAVPAAQPSDALDAEITLERTACFGTCPVYSVRINGDGTVEYVGKQYVRVVGPAQSRIPRAALQQLLDLIQKAGYFEMDAEYRYLIGPNGTRGTVTDLPTTITSVRIGTRTHRIVDYVGAPDALHDIERHIDRAAGTAEWIANQRPAKKEGSARSRIVCRPGAACSTFGTELTAMDAVATSPWMPPAIFIARFGDPSISTASYVSGDPRYASMWSLMTGSPFLYPIPSWMMPQT